MSNLLFNNTKEFNSYVSSLEKMRDIAEEFSYYVKQALDRSDDLEDMNIREAVKKLEDQYNQFMKSISSIEKEKINLGGNLTALLGQARKVKNESKTINEEVSPEVSALLRTIKMANGDLSFMADKVLQYSKDKDEEDLRDVKKVKEELPGTLGKVNSLLGNFLNKI